MLDTILGFACAAEDAIMQAALVAIVRDRVNSDDDPEVMCISLMLFLV